MKQHQDEGCGTKRQPWIVETMKGQTISVGSITTASDDDPKTSSEEKLKCPDEDVVGYILDKSINRNITICTRVGGIPYQYNSTSHVIEVVVVHKTDGSPLFFKLRGNKVMKLHLIIQFIFVNSPSFVNLIATGCSDLIPPADAWLKRTENEATIGCYSTRLRWQLKCVGQNWIGVIGNCSYGIFGIPFKKNTCI